MSMKINRFFLAASVALLFSSVLSAQDGAFSSYSPYSVFGVGNMSRQGNAYTLSMGGVGLASRSNRFVNIVNPAAVTARDTLSFMLDFGLTLDNRVYRQGDVKSANNIFNLSNFVFSVPIWKKSALYAGITPYSSLGYDFSHRMTDPSIIGNTGNVTYSCSGSGGMYQIFLGAGATFFKNLSIGAQVTYYFGNMFKSTNMDFASSSYRDISSGYTMNLRAVGGKFGIQYDKSLGGGYFITLGATYSTSAKMKGFVTDYKYASISSVSDTLHHSIDTLGKGSKMRLASEYGVGFSLRKGDKWRMEINYLCSDWSGTHIDEVTGFSNQGETKFSTTFSQSFRAGFEFIPNRNDIRYYMKRCSYRAGLYYDNDYFKVNGNKVTSYGITLGITLPVFRWYNGVSLGLDVGRRGSAADGMIRETYAAIAIGFNIHDIWFQKPKYE